MIDVVLITGGNLGDVAINLERARLMLIRELGSEVACSSVFSSEAWGFEAKEQFLNQVLVLTTELPPQAVLAVCHSIESELGRVRDEVVKVATGMQVASSEVLTSLAACGQVASSEVLTPIAACGHVASSEVLTSLAACGHFASSEVLTSLAACGQVASSEILVSTTTEEPIFDDITIHSGGPVTPPITCTPSATITQSVSVTTALPDTMSPIGSEKRIYSSRSMDIDILFYGNQVVNEANLIIPHPHIAKREFVLRPLSEVLSKFVHPITGESVEFMLQRFSK